MKNWWELQQRTNRDDHEWRILCHLTTDILSKALNSDTNSPYFYALVFYDDSLLALTRFKVKTKNCFSIDATISDPSNFMMSDDCRKRGFGTLLKLYGLRYGFELPGMVVATSYASTHVSAKINQNLGMKRLKNTPPQKNQQSSVNVPQSGQQNIVPQHHNPDLEYLELSQEHGGEGASVNACHSPGE
ncbi:MULTISPECIES: hypothetical protein [Cysteiniphilum]|uniref:hypothetical protein n=1 Tax=Cysteiniphilum TaxID=2056696 RepID=UPI00177B4BA2|nr:MULTISPECIES: hypothetical protein [Cysteiniphilum]